MAKKKKKVKHPKWTAVPPEDVLGVNTPEQLEQVDRILRERLAREGQSTDSP